MTVEELIKELRSFNPGAEVAIEDGEWGPLAASPGDAALEVRIGDARIGGTAMMYSPGWDENKVRNCVVIGWR